MLRGVQTMYLIIIVTYYSPTKNIYQHSKMYIQGAGELNKFKFILDNIGIVFLVPISAAHTFVFDNFN